MTLVSFPFVHSDEAWLSGLTRHMINTGTLKTTEPFFIEYPRVIHGLRLIFIGFQAVFIKMFGYSITSVRALSLMVSLIALFFTKKILEFYKFSTIETLLALLILSLNIQFIYASHMARQEIFILTIMIISYYVNLKELKPIMTGSLIGLAIGIHPNSFFIAVMMGCVYLVKTFKSSKMPLIKLIITSALYALLFVLISFYLNPSFISEYIQYGQSLGISNFEIGRLKGFYFYYYKLFHEIGGTYLLLPIKPDLILLIVSSIWAIIKRHEDNVYLFLAVIGINIGYIIVGRYNQTAIIFTLFFNMLYLLTSIKKIKYKKLSYLILLILALSVFTSGLETTSEDYRSLEQHLNLEGKVLANLNLDYHFEDGQLIDYRNLWHVEDFESYIRTHNIDYVILSEEMSYIKSTSPKWDILYGHLPYYDTMISYLETCTLVDEFHSETYGIRIARYIDTYPWYIKIYKTK